ncbi:hypothetical protein JCM8547_005360 [Rhodosporidiobolus lusitaniae]
MTTTTSAPSTPQKKRHGDSTVPPSSQHSSSRPPPPVSSIITSSSHAPSFFLTPRRLRLVPDPAPTPSPALSADAAHGDGGDWIDEDDDLVGFSGGPGQGRNGAHGESLSPPTLSSTSSSAVLPGLNGFGAAVVATFADSPVAKRTWSSNGGGGGTVDACEEARSCSSGRRVDAGGRRRGSATSILVPRTPDLRSPSTSSPPRPPSAPTSKVRLAAAAIMPLVAKTFVDSASNTSFEMVSPSIAASPRRAAAAYYASPSPRRKERTPQKKPLPSPKRRTPARRGGGAQDNVHSWSDQTLASRYQFLEEVGYGNWGSVWKVQQKLEGPDVPIRSVKLVHRSNNPTSSARVRALWTEFKCIRTLRNAPHPNVIDFREFIITPSYAIISMSYHPRLMPVALSEQRGRPYFMQLLSAVGHLHSLGITHQDLKPANILLSEEDRPILIDFGFATQPDLASPDRFLSSLSWGTPEYLAPERAKGQLHDERLSDIWALGVTFYEIIVGRTPFEETEEESFLHREQLEVYYGRTLTGRFFGDYILSHDFKGLIHMMVEPKVELRAQRCEKLLSHKFFSRSPAPSRYATPADTPTRAPQKTPSSLVQTPVSTTKPTPRKTPKSHERKKDFAIFEEEPDVPSPARTGTSKTPFSPRPALVDRVNRVPIAAPSTPKPFLLKKTPPPSRIPVCKHNIGSSTPLVPKTPRSGAVLGHRRLFSSPTLPSRSTFPPVPPVPPLPSPENINLSRSSSLKSVRRKPVPVLDEVTLAAEKGEELAKVLQDSPTVPVSPTLNDTPTYASRSYTIKVGSKKSKLLSEKGSTNFSSHSEVLSSELPRLGRKSSSALATHFRKLSVKTVRRAPSTMSFSGTKRRASTESFAILDGEKVVDEGSSTMPMNLGSQSDAPQVQRARLESFSRNLQHLLDARNVKSASPATQVDEGEQSRSGSPASFSYNGTAPLSFINASSLSTPPPKPDKTSVRKPPASKLESSPTSWRPSHRRIPTAIRDLPAVAVSDYTDDGDWSETDGSRADTPFSERVASPPPSARVLEAARVLPTWVPASSDEEDDGDVDEPTVKISSPIRKKSKASSNKHVTPRNSPIKPHQASIPRSPAPNRPPLTRSSTSLSFTLDNHMSKSTSSTRPTTPTANLPFSNFERADSRASTFSSAASKSGLQHKRSRSILSFFFGGSEDGEADRSRSVSRMSNTSSLGWSASSEAPAKGLPKGEPEREKKKRGGRIKRIASKLLR